MKLKATSVKALEKYKLFIQFNDETEGVIDLSDIAGKGVFKTWDNDENFNKVFIDEESKAISWPNEIDIDTYNAYFTIHKITPADYFNKEKKYAASL